MREKIIGLIAEIFEIPHLARICFEKNKGLVLPEKVPYIGMGSSYFAALCLRYQGVKIYPQLASEYFHYLDKTKQFDRAVLISQSGASSETFWCADLFQSFVSIVNDMNSPLAKHENLDFSVDLFAGIEKYSPSKTFINSLVVLFTGHGINPQQAIDALNYRYVQLVESGNELGKNLYKNCRKSKRKGFYVVGSGPNYGTAKQGALILTESTRIPFIGLSLSEYDHGMKESAENSVVIFLNPSGKQTERCKKVRQKVEEAGAICFEINETELSEDLSPFTLSIPLFSATAWLAQKLRIKHPFVVGEKVTRVTM